MLLMALIIIVTAFALQNVPSCLSFLGAHPEDVHGYTSCPDCSQHCLLNMNEGNFEDYYSELSCACAPGYKFDSEEEDKKIHCVAESGSGFLLISYLHGISKMSLSDNKVTTIFEDLNSEPIAIDYNYHGNEVYWADNKDGSIWAISVNDSSFNRKRKIYRIRHHNQGQPVLNHGLAFDFVRKYIYYADIHNIWVIHVDQGWSKKLIYNDLGNGTERIVGFAIDPVRFIMFWVSVRNDSNYQIVKCGLNGDYPTIFKRYKYNEIIDGITTDTVTGKLFISYRSTLLRKIYWVDYRLFNVTYPIYNSLIGLPNVENEISSLTTFQGVLYWINGTEILSDISYIDDNNVEIIKKIPISEKVKNIKDLSAYHEVLQSKTNVDPCVDSWCSHFCLPGPHKVHLHAVNITCHCPDDFHLANDSVTCLSNVVSKNDAENEDGSSTYSLFIKKIVEFLKKLKLIC